MANVDIVVLPTMYVCAIIFGFMLNTCSKRKMIEKLEDENHDMEWQNSILTQRLDDAEKRLRSISEQLTEPINS